MEIQRKAKEVVFTVSGVAIETVSEFKYLGRILSDDDSDEAAVARNLKRARQKWGMIGRVLSRKGADPKSMARFYMAVVQSVLLYGSETWVLTKWMEKSLESFHRRCARFLTGRSIWKDADEVWHYPSSSETLKQAGLEPIEEYIRRRKETIMKFAEKREVYAACVASTPLASNPNQLVWWD
jgi:hypothetical protein